MPANFKSHIFSALLSALNFIIYLAPWLIGGIVLAAILNTFVPLDKPVKFLKAKKWWILPVAGLLGLVSPACTYGTVPIFAQMIKRGAPMGPAAAFLVSSALVNPQMFILTLAALGWPVAIAQAAAAWVFAVGIGMLVNWAMSRGIDIEGSELKATRKAEEDSMHGHSGAMHHSDSNGHSAEQMHKMKQDGAHKHHHKHDAMKTLPWPRRLGINFIDLFEFIGFYFVMGTLIAVLVAEFIPKDLILSAVGEGKWWAVPFATVVSIPTYVCGGGTIPFIAQARDMGMSMGAVLAFLIAGPATRITALSALSVLFKKRVVLIYVVLLLVFAVVLGSALGHFVQTMSTPKQVNF